MSLTSGTALVQYTQSAPGQTFSVTFYFLADADIAVVRTRAGVDTTLALTTDYTVAASGTNPPTGSVTVLAGIADDIVTIYRNGALTQGTNFTSNGPFPALTITQKVDYLTMLVQQLELQCLRSLRIPNSNAASKIPEGTLAQRTDAFPHFDIDGVLEWIATADLIALLSSEIAAAVADAEASAAAAAASAAAAAASAGVAGTPFLALLSHDELRAVVVNGTTPLTENTMRIVSIDLASEQWMLISGSEADDDVSYIRPNDYTDKVWARIS